MRKLTAIAVPKNVAVATQLARDSIELPARPLPDVQPPAVLAPKPISTPATSSSARDREPPPNVSVSHE